MKQMWFHFVASTVLFSSLAGAQSSDTEASKPGPEHGTIVDHLYTNECLGFSYPIPDGWEVNNEVGGVTPEGEARPLSGGGLVLLVLDQHRGRAFRNRI